MKFANEEREEDSEEDDQESRGVSQGDGKRCFRTGNELRVLGTEKRSRRGKQA